jgi:hypothetical protein
MRRKTLYVAGIVALLSFTIVSGARAPGITGQQGLEMMKKMAGSWSGTMMKKDGPPATVTYEVTSGGTAVLEKLDPGGQYEMTTVYYLDGADLLATHYCAAGNQPMMKLNTKLSDEKKLVFDFVRVTGLKKPDESYIHNVTHSLVEGNKLESVWQSSSASSEDEMKFFLARGK